MEIAPRRDIDAGRIIKVNHAGEHGAVNIYAGQMAMARLRARSMLHELAEFKSHEERHRAIFAKELQRRGLPRCRSYLLCGVGGYVLGFAYGSYGRSGYRDRDRGGRASGASPFGRANPEHWDH